MKKVLIFTMVGLLMTFSKVMAQEEGKFRVGMDMGLTIPSSGGGGFLIYLEPKYNIKDNMNIGLRVGVAAMARDLIYYSNID
jgi:hypothetical protein